MDKFPDKKYPMFIFEDEMSGMSNAGLSNTSKNADLAISFYHSRNGHADEFPRSVYNYCSHPDSRSVYNNCSHPKSHEKDDSYLSNSAAAMLYKKRDSSNEYVRYWIKGGEKEYHCISHVIRNKSGVATNYGHAEKQLMKAILDDLIISEYKNDRNPKVKHPSHEMYKAANDGKSDLGEEGNIIRNMVENASQYKDFLESNGFIVKVWSERNMCYTQADDHCCNTFMYNICPQGSESGHLVLMKNEKELRPIWDKIRAKWKSSPLDTVDARGAADATLENGGGTSKRGASPPNEERKKLKYK